MHVRTYVLVEPPGSCVQLPSTPCSYKPLQYRESEVCRGLSHAFEVVRLTFSNHIFTRGSRCVWYLYTCSGWFIRSELPRTISNHFNAEKTMCVEVYHMSSGWSFSAVEPPGICVQLLSTPCSFGRVRLYQTVSNCIFSGGTRCGE